MNDRRKELFEKYKDLFRIYHDSSPAGRRMPISWGLEIGDGWLSIVEDLCALIQNYVDWKKRIDPKYPQVEVHQCKEKFGSLRFYVSHQDDFISGLITMAEQISARTCEKCGVEAKIRKDGWWRVTCDPCEQQRSQGFSRQDTPLEIQDKNEQP